MNLQEKVNTDIKAAMIAKDSLALGVLRMLKAGISNTAIEKREQELDDQTVLGIIRKNIKTRQDSVEAFIKGNRLELAEKEESEIKVLEVYLPVQLSVADVEKLVKDAISEAGATTKKEMGKVMKLATEMAAGRVDGKTLSTIIMKSLV